MKSLYYNLEKKHNRGALIDHINLSVGSYLGAAYCSNGLIYCSKLNFIPLKANPRAKSWLMIHAIKRNRGRFIRNAPIIKADIALFQWSASQWHVEMVTQWHIPGDKMHFRTGGFNTGAPFDPKRKRQGIFPHLRRKQDAIILDYQAFWKLSPSQIRKLHLLLSQS